MSKNLKLKRRYKWIGSRLKTNPTTPTSYAVASQQPQYTQHQSQKPQYTQHQSQQSFYLSPTETCSLSSINHGHFIVNNQTSSARFDKIPRYQPYTNQSTLSTQQLSFYPNQHHTSLNTHPHCVGDVSSSLNHPKSREYSYWRNTHRNIKQHTHPSYQQYHWLTNDGSFDCKQSESPNYTLLYEQGSILAPHVSNAYDHISLMSLLTLDQATDSSQSLSLATSNWSFSPTLALKTNAFYQCELTHELFIQDPCIHFYTHVDHLLRHIILYIQQRLNVDATMMCLKVNLNSTTCIMSPQQSSLSVNQNNAIHGAQKDKKGACLLMHANDDHFNAFMVFVNHQFKQLSMRHTIHDSSPLCSLEKNQNSQSTSSATTTSAITSFTHIPFKSTLKNQSNDIPCANKTTPKLSKNPSTMPNMDLYHHFRLHFKHVMQSKLYHLAESSIMFLLSLDDQSICKHNTCVPFNLPHFSFNGMNVLKKCLYTFDTPHQTPVNLTINYIPYLNLKSPSIDHLPPKTGLHTDSLLSSSSLTLAHWLNTHSELAKQFYQQRFQ